MNKIGMNGNVIRASDEIARYLERIPGFLTVEDFDRVMVFKTLRQKIKATVIKHLEQRSNVATFTAKRTSSGREVQLYRHIKHGPVSSIPGYIYPLEPALNAPPGLPPEKVTPPPARQMCEACGHDKPLADFVAIPGDGYCKTCSSCMENLCSKAEIGVEKSEINMNKSGLAGLTPEQMRQLAADLQQQANLVEKNTASRDAINKQLEPVRRDALMTGATLTRKFEELFDAMSAHEKALAALRNFKVA